MIAAFVALLLQAAAPAAPPPPDWAASELVVSATPGPVFWRVARGGGVVWILGVPDTFARDVRWDTRRLEGVLDGARMLLTVPIYTLRGGRRAGPGPKSVEARLPPELAARFAAARAQAGRPAARYDGLPLVDAAHRLRADLYASYGVSRLADDEVRRLAARRLIPVRPLSRHEVESAATDAAEPQGARCVAGALADAAFARDHAAAATRAWAVGDLRAVRDNSAKPQVAACLDGIGAFDAVHARYPLEAAAAIGDALDRGGHSVALLTLGALLNRDGVLPRLRAAGASVTAPQSAPPPETPAP